MQDLKKAFQEVSCDAISNKNILIIIAGELKKKECLYLF